MSNPISFYENLKLLFLIAGCLLAGIAVIEFFSFRILRIIRMRLYRSGLLKFHPEEEIGKKAYTPVNSASLEGVQENSSSGSLPGSQKLRSGSLELAKEDASSGAEETSLLDENLSQDKNISEGTEETSLLSNDRASSNLSRDNSTQDKSADRKLSRDNFSPTNPEDNSADGSEETGLLHSNLSRDNFSEEGSSEADGAAPTSLLQEEDVNLAVEEEGSAATSLLKEETDRGELQPDLSQDKFSCAEDASYGEETSEKSRTKNPKRWDLEHKEPEQRDSSYDGSESTTLLNNSGVHDGSHVGTEYKEQNVRDERGDGSESTTLLKKDEGPDETSERSDGSEDTALLRDTGPDETDRDLGDSSGNKSQSSGRMKSKYPGFVIDTEDIVTHDNE